MQHQVQQPGELPRLSERAAAGDGVLTETEGRARVIEVAKGWLRTPYHHLGAIKGVGIDCAMLLAEVFREAGVVPHISVEIYSPQWHLHHSEEKYIAVVSQYAREITGPPMPGDVVLFRFGRTFSHGAIVIAWPTIIHARIDSGCEYEDALQCAWLATIGEAHAEQGKPRPRKFFSCW